jgi:hypothetical protein
MSPFEVSTRRTCEVIIGVGPRVLGNAPLTRFFASYLSQPPQACQQKHELNMGEAKGLSAATIRRCHCSVARHSSSPGLSAR